MRELLWCSHRLALLLLAPTAASAQIGGGGSIQGTVLDTSNAPVPGATVTATNVATGIDTVRQTTDAGVYALTPLPPGEYRVTVTLDGFQTVRPRGHHRRCAERGRPERHAAGRPASHRRWWSRPSRRRSRPPTPGSARRFATRCTPRCRW